MKTFTRAGVLFLSLGGCIAWMAAGAGTPGGATSGLAGAKNVAAATLRTFHYENVLGTSLEMKLRVGSDAEADRAEASVLQEFDRENLILSAWTPESEFSRWMKTRGTAEKVSPELFEVLALFDTWREKTGGALDASAEAAVQVWKTAAAEGRKPTEAELAAAVAMMQRQHWRLDWKARTATHLDDAPIALNSFAKSYISGHAADAALQAGATGVELNVGGDIVLRGNVTDTVAIANPRADAENDPPVDMVKLAGRTIATSGAYRRGVEVGGKHFSHIVDPRTGETAEAVLSSTVVAREASEAGALATAFSVMTPEESARLANELGGVEYLLPRREGGVLASMGWAGLETARVVEAGYRAPSGSAGGGGAGAARAKAAAAPVAAPMDLLMTLEIARVDNPRYRRPYVAVWVEDAEKKPVRLISLWSEKPRYLNELRSWYHDYPMATMNGGEISPSTSSATRSPGKYTLRWDGKDDKGNAVKPGKYTVLVEATREHGGYDLMHQEINFDGKTPAQFSLPAGNELAGVTLDYGRHGQ